MPDLTTLSKEVSVVGENVTIIETVEKKLTKDDLLREKMAYQQRQQQLVMQNKEIIRQHKELQSSIDEVDRTLAQMENTSIPESI